MSFRKEFDKWKKDNNQHGARAYSRFVMLRFTSELASLNSHYVFKGGNLLWLYINTPRSTVDIDFASKLKPSREQIETDLSIVSIDGIEFSLKSFESKDDAEGVGAKIVITYKDNQGSDGSFPIDIVFDINTDIRKIEILKKSIEAASMENIICDKLSACHDFGGGNTRMKDFDDLFRIVTSHKNKYDRLKLESLLEIREIESHIPKSYLSEKMQEDWTNYLNKQYGKKSDIPWNITEVVEIINSNLK